MITLLCGEQEWRSCITIFCPVMLSNYAMTASTASQNTSSTTELWKYQKTWSGCIKQILHFCSRSSLYRQSDSGNMRCVKKESTRLLPSLVLPLISRESSGDEPNGSNLTLHSWCLISIKQRQQWKSQITMGVITANWVSTTERTALSSSNQHWQISMSKTALQIFLKFVSRSYQLSKKLFYHLTSIIFSNRFHTRRNQLSNVSVLTLTQHSNLAPTGW
jgi:hypothetical protein